MIELKIVPTKAGDINEANLEMVSKGKIVGNEENQIKKQKLPSQLTSKAKFFESIEESPL